jgi:GAF domain-containing protein
MFELQSIDTADKAQAYAELQRQLSGLLHGERDPIANMANTASLIFHSLPDLNWAGFYLMRGNELVLGPFHGKPACVRIAIGRGVCGSAVSERRTMLVEDVHAFPDHIACDVASRSEIVIPLIRDGKVEAVLDLDAPIPGRFDAADQSGLETLVATLVAGTDPLHL